MQRVKDISGTSQTAFQIGLGKDAVSVGAITKPGVLQGEERTPDRVKDFLQTAPRRRLAAGEVQIATRNEVHFFHRETPFIIDENTTYVLDEGAEVVFEEGPPPVAVTSSCFDNTYIEFTEPATEQFFDIGCDVKAGAMVLAVVNYPAGMGIDEDEIEMDLPIVSVISVSDGSFKILVKSLEGPIVGVYAITYIYQPR